MNDLTKRKENDSCECAEYVGLSPRTKSLTIFLVIDFIRGLWSPFDKDTN